MKRIASKSDIRSILINVSQKILKKNLLDFVLSSLDLNNIKYAPLDNISCTFLEYSNQYQIFVFDNSFEHMIFELVYDVKEDNQKGIFSLYITKDFFVIFNGNTLYTYQKISQYYDKEELIEYISKSLNISITKIKELTELDLDEIIKRDIYNPNISFLQNINKKSQKLFYIYIMYLLFCILSTILYKNYEEEYLRKDNLQKLQESEKEYLNTIQTLKYNFFGNEYSRLLEVLRKFDLNLISFSYSSKSMKIKISSKNKEKIYLFLEYYKSDLLANNLTKSDSQSVFIGVLDVQINR